MAANTNVINDTGVQRQQIVDRLKTIVNQYNTEHTGLNSKLDNNHHAYVMKEFGEDKQLKETMEELRKLYVRYDTKTYTVTYALNGCTMSGSMTAPETYYAIPESEITLPNKGGITPPVGKLVYGWCEKADGTGTRYKFGSKFKMPIKNVTLYALLGPDPDYEPPEEE